MPGSRRRLPRPRLLSLIGLALTGIGFAQAQPPADPGAPPSSARAESAPAATSGIDWRDQILYFVMTDRFDDGDPSNNDQRAGEFDARDTAKYNGGDLGGIERRLGYIRGMGVTGIWITPPVANLWWDSVAHHGGYHGYWAENFMAVDAHLGTLADYRRLADKIHGAGMTLVQDIVLNHTGSYFDYQGGWNPAAPQEHFKLIPDSGGHTAPSQWPFSMNDVRSPAHRAAAVYHWTPDISDFREPLQTSNFQMSGLDDLNSENPLVRTALRKSYDFWIREIGVDGFRIDTAFYVPKDALADFLYADDPSNPGVIKAAQQAGRTNFHVFGEGFSIDKAYEETQARRIDELMHQSDGSPLLPGMLNFPLYASIGDAFARGRPTAELSYRIASMMRVHEQPELMPSFLDNHDVDRFLAGGGQAGMKQALLLMMTLPGIPTIYYGTEQGFTGQRAAMFAAGSGSGGVDHFDTDAPLYRFVQRVTALRREHRVFSRGRPTVLKDNAAGPGVLAYRMNHGDDSALVVFNTSDGEALLDNLDTGLDAGVVLTGLFDINGKVGDEVTAEEGRVTLRLPPRSGKVWRISNRRVPLLKSGALITLDALAEAVVAGDFPVSGTASGVRALQLVVDGDLASATNVPVDAQGHWAALLDTGTMVDPLITHRVVAWAQSSGAVSASREFKVSRQWTELADVADPMGDDNGPKHNYQYPTDAGWRKLRQLDIQRVRIAGSGGAMKISLRMNAISTPWNPPNGFDHVAFSVFVQIPGKDGGIAAMPLQHADLPDGMRWHYRLRAHGWSNALFSSTGASAVADGTAVAPAATILVDASDKTVSFLIPGSALGGI
ncbi:MAG: alpha-amylase family glycosyl hydrolase, partial [Arenimonas sp.]